MSITARPGDTFTADLIGAPSTLGATLSVGIRELPSGTMVSAFATTGITETALGGGISNYAGVRVAPTVVSQADADGPRYVVVWKIGATEQPPEDLHVSGTVPADSLVPSLADIGDLLRARTKDVNGNELGTFDADTRPTGEEVERLVGQAVSDVTLRAGAAIPDALTESVRWLATIRTGMLVELSYFPEQTTASDSTYANLKALYDEQMTALLANLTTDPGDVQGFGSLPIASPTAAAHHDEALDLFNNPSQTPTP